MAKKRKARAQAEPVRKAAPQAAFDSPFRELKKLFKDRPEVLPSTAAAKPKASDDGIKPAVPSLEDEATLLREAFDGVRPMGGSGRERIGVEPPVGRNIVSEDAEVLAQLSDLVAGQGAFELTETEEYLEGARIGLDPRLVSRLRRGDFSMQAHIDLHGMTQVDAKQALSEFILESVRKGRRAVLVVHGRGLRSPGGRPVLKHATAQWLSHGIIGGYVLAFATAQTYDGGAGAVWVLLRRERRRGKFDVLLGAKRRD